MLAGIDGNHGLKALARRTNEDRTHIRIGEEFRPLGSHHRVIGKHRVILQVEIRLEPSAVSDRLRLGR